MNEDIDHVPIICDSILAYFVSIRPWKHIIVFDEGILQFFGHEAQKHLAVGSPVPQPITHIWDFLPVLFAGILMH